MPVTSVHPEFGAREATLIKRPATTLLAATSVVALTNGLAPLDAQAVDACAPAVPGDTVIVLPDAGQFPTGITCDVNDVTLVLQGDSDAPVIIDTDAAHGVLFEPMPTSGAATFVGEGSTSVTVSDPFYHGVIVASVDGPVDATMAGNVTTSGDYSVGIIGASYYGDVSIDVSGNVDILGDGDSIGDSPGIHVHAHYGAVDVTLSGNVVTAPKYSAGIDVQAHFGPVDVDVTGSIQTMGRQSAGIFSVNTGNVADPATVDVSVSGGTIATAGLASAGIVAGSQYDAVNVTLTDSSITTTGERGDGIYAASGAAGITVLADDASDIDTQGYSATAVTARARGGDVSITMDGDAATAGQFAGGVQAIAEEEGNVFVAIGGSVATLGDNAQGVHASAGEGTAEVHVSGSISTQGERAGGVDARSDAAVIIAIDGSVETEGAYSNGVDVDAKYNEGSADISVSGSVATIGDGSNAIDVDVKYSADIDVAGTLTTRGNNAIGIHSSSHEAILSSTNVSGDIETFGEEAWGIAASNDYGAQNVNVSGSVTTHGDYSRAVHAISRGNDAPYYGGVNIDVSGAVVSAGDYSAGVAGYAYGGDVDIDISGNVSTQGVYSHGVMAMADGGVVDIRVTGAIAATGADSTGIFAYATGSTHVEVNDVLGGFDGVDAWAGANALTVTVNGAVVGGTGAGIRTQAPYGASIVVSGTGSVSAASGIAIDTAVNNDYSADDSVAVSGSVVGDVFLHNGSDRVTFTASADVSGLGVIDGGDDNSVDDGFIDRLLLEGTQGSVTGTTFLNFEDIVLRDGADITITDIDGTPLQASYANGFGLHLEDGSKLDLSSGIDVLANIDINDTSLLVTGGTTDSPHRLDGWVYLEGGISMASGAPTGNTRIADFLASEGGSLTVDAGIGAGGEPITADVLVVEGDLDGDLNIFVNTLDEVGLETDDPLFVVQGEVSGDVQLGHRVDHGIYYFGLEEDDQAWYLVNDGIFEQVSAYESVTSLLGVQNQQTIGSLRQRVGARSVWDAKNRTAQAVWVQGEYQDARGDSGIGDHSGGFSGDRLFAQLGIDVVAFETGETTFVASVFGTLGNSDLDARDMSGAATGGADIDDYGVGVGITLYHGGNFYLDAVFQASWQDIDFASAGGVTGETSADGLSGAIELGYNVDLSNGWSLAPQAQLVLGSIDIDDYVDSDAIAVAQIGKAKSVLGRFGLTLERNTGGNFIGYLRTGISEEFKGGGQLVFNGQTVGWDYGGTSIEVLLGGSYRLGENSHIFAEFNYADHLSGPGIRRTGGKAGLRIGF